VILMEAKKWRNASAFFNSLFLGCTTFLALLLIILLKVEELTHALAVAGLLIGVGALYGFTAVKKSSVVASLGVLWAVFFILLTSLGVGFMSTFAFSLLLLSCPFAYYNLLGKKSFRQTMKRLGITRKDLAKNIAIGIGVTVFIIFPIIMIETAFFTVMGLNDLQNVNNAILDAPWYVSAFAIAIGPFGEEMFFRAFLVPAIGVLPSAFLFSIAHYSYNSVVEFAGALTLGIAYGYMFKHTKSVVSVITAHALFNLTSITLLYLSQLFI